MPPCLLLNHLWLTPDPTKHRALQMACLRQFTQCIILPATIACREGGQKGKGVVVSNPIEGVEFLYYLTASPPNTPPIYGPSAVNVYGVAAVNVYGKNVSNCLPPPFWHYLYLNVSALVFTALFAPACSTFTALVVRTLHPKFCV